MRAAEPPESAGGRSGMPRPPASSDRPDPRRIIRWERYRARASEPAPTDSGTYRAMLSACISCVGSYPHDDCGRTGRFAEPGL
jgi:hypothetical protein